MIEPLQMRNLKRNVLLASLILEVVKLVYLIQYKDR